MASDFTDDRFPGWIVAAQSDCLWRRAAAPALLDSGNDPAWKASALPAVLTTRQELSVNSKIVRAPLKQGTQLFQIQVALQVVENFVLDLPLAAQADQLGSPTSDRGQHCVKVGAQVFHEGIRVPRVSFRRLGTLAAHVEQLRVDTSDVSGPWDQPGSDRVVHLADGSLVKEGVTHHQRARYFAYRVSNPSFALKYLMIEARGQFWFEQRGPDVDVKWTYTFVATNRLAKLPLRLFVQTQWKGYMAVCLKNIMKHFATR